MKQLTGGDKVTARFMRQDNFTFTPRFKLVIVGNHKPVLTNVDDAAKRRLNMIPFPLTRVCACACEREPDDLSHLSHPRGVGLRSQTSETRRS